MATEIVTAVLAGLTTIAVTIIGYKQALKTKQLELELKDKDKFIKESNKSFGALAMLLDFELVNTITEKIDYLFNKTKIDRFLVLIAVNGKVDPNTVSVIFEQHKDNDGNIIKVNALTRYRHVYIDDQYRQMLKQAELLGGVYYETDTMPESYLKNVYLDEAVTSSVIKYITRINIDDHNDMIVFCSLATHKGRLNDIEKTNIHAEFGSIRSAFKKYYEKLKTLGGS